jgi:hypothetical protein
MGERVMALTKQDAGAGLNLNIGSLPVGTYLVRISDGNRLALGRFVKL